jgi:hypothetical protein
MAAAPGAYGYRGAGPYPPRPRISAAADEAMRQAKRQVDYQTSEAYYVNGPRGFSR